MQTLTCKFYFVSNSIFVRENFGKCAYPIEVETHILLEILLSAKPRNIYERKDVFSMVTLDMKYDYLIKSLPFYPIVSEFSKPYILINLTKLELMNLIKLLESDYSKELGMEILKSAL